MAEDASLYRWIGELSDNEYHNQTDLPTTSKVNEGLYTLQFFSEALTIYILGN